MRSMNKYGVILVGGTIGSVFAGGNCSGKGKENEDEKNFKKFFCECFTGVTDSNFLVTSIFHTDDVPKMLDGLIHKLGNDISKSATHLVFYAKDTERIAGLIKLGDSESLKPTNNIDKTKSQAEDNDIKKGVFAIYKINLSKDGANRLEEYKGVYTIKN